MRSHSKLAHVIGSWIMIGAAVIGFSLCSPRDAGPLACFIALVVGVINLIVQSRKREGKE
jgi:hypothetical protein